MAIYNLGRILPFFKGDYVEGETYKKLDLVYVKGVGTYVANQTTSEYPVDNEEWTLVCENGKKGDKGDKGDRGLDGLTEEEAREIIEAYNYITMQDVEDKNYTTMAEVEAKNYLTEVPSEYITETELEAKNYTTMSEVEAKNYLTQVPDTYATKTWVEDKNYLTQVPSEYVTETELEAKNYTTMSAVENKGYTTMSAVESKGYTTMAAVEAKGYLTQVPAGYATETWVEGKNYLTEHQPLKTINNESIVGTGDIEIKGGSEIQIIEIDLVKTYSDAEFDEIKNHILNKTALFTVYFQDSWNDRSYIVDCRWDNDEILLLAYTIDFDSGHIVLGTQPYYLKKDTHKWVTYDPDTIITNDALLAKNYITISAVEAKNYTTMAAVEAKNYTTMSAV